MTIPHEKQCSVCLSQSVVQCGVAGLLSKCAPRDGLRPPDSFPTNFGNAHSLVIIVIIIFIIIIIIIIIVVIIIIIFINAKQL